MQSAYEELVERVEIQNKIITSQQNQIGNLTNTIDEQNKRIIKLEKELHKYINENTPSGAIPPYLKKLEETVNKFTKQDDDKKEPKDNKRNMRSNHTY